MEDIQTIIARMDPEHALAEITVALKRLFPLLDDEARLGFIMELTGETDQDKVSSMVHL